MGSGVLNLSDIHRGHTVGRLSYHARAWVSVIAAFVAGCATIVIMWNGQNTMALTPKAAREIASQASDENKARSAQTKVFCDARDNVAVLLQNCERAGQVGMDARELVRKLREQLREK